MPLAASSTPPRTAPRPPSALKLRRLALGLRQIDVAAGADLSREQVIRLEAGECVPKVSSAARLAATLDCDLGVIFPMYDASPAGQPGSVTTSAGEVGRDGRPPS